MANYRCIHKNKIVYTYSKFIFLSFLARLLPFMLLFSLPALFVAFISRLSFTFLSSAIIFLLFYSSLHLFFLSYYHPPASFLSLPPISLFLLFPTPAFHPQCPPSYLVSSSANFPYFTASSSLLSSSYTFLFHFTFYCLVISHTTFHHFLILSPLLLFFFPHFSSLTSVFSSSYLIFYYFNSSCLFLSFSDLPFSPFPYFHLIFPPLSSFTSSFLFLLSTPFSSFNSSHLPVLLLPSSPPFLLLSSSS